MSFLDKLSKIKIPSHKSIANIPSNLKTETQQIELNTVDIVFFSHDWTNAFLTTGIKKRLSKRPSIDVKLPEKLSFLESDKSSCFNLTTKRNLYLVNEKSPYTLPLDSIKLKSSTIHLNPSHDENQNDEVTEVDLTPKMLSTLGTVRLIDDINEKTNDGIGVVFIIGCLVGLFGGIIIASFLFR